MSEHASLHIYSSDTRALEGPRYLNTVLENDYKIGLFDLAYLLAISLNGEFMPKSERKQYLGQWEDLKKQKRLLEQTRTQLPDNAFFSRLIVLIDEYLESINRGLLVTRNRPGQDLNAKTRMILLWTYMLRLRDPVRYPETLSIADSRLVEEIHGIKKSIKWGDFYKLLKWFHLKLEKCSYSNLIMPNNDEGKEITRAKSLLEKHTERGDNTKNWYNAKARIWAYISLQRLLVHKGQRSAEHRKRIELFAEPFPIMLVKFNTDSIEIGKLKNNKIVSRRYASIGKRVQPVEELGNTELKNKKNPLIVFPDGEVFESEYYRPPFHHAGGSLLGDIWEPRQP